MLPSIGCRSTAIPSPGNAGSFSILSLYYLVLALPFFCSGVGIGAGLAIGGGHGHLVYAANLLGSAWACCWRCFALTLAGVPGAVLASALIGLLPAVIGPAESDWCSPHSLSRWIAVAILIVGAAGFGALAVRNAQGRAPLGLVLSPYKGLAYALRYPGAETVFGRWNAISRADVVVDAGTRLLPGLSYTFTGAPPPQAGLSLDADSPQPITLIPAEAFAAADYLPEALAFRLRPGGRNLVLEPGGGLGVLQALAATPKRAGQPVTAVISNPLVRAAVGQAAPSADVYADPRVRTVIESPRVYLRRAGPSYDVIFLPLTDAYRPISSGAYGLGETYGLTVEAFADALARLAPDGVLAATRWLQTPPSESVRLVATLVEALAQARDRPSGRFAGRLPRHPDDHGAGAAGRLVGGRVGHGARVHRGATLRSRLGAGRARRRGQSLQPAAGAGGLSSRQVAADRAGSR